ncbi:MAG TPA: NUDIX domain-containing protein [Candidatus Limiplasma sp.]|nr:NUDIX domain-containing protein [Candidatus Limiplasma sp.]HPS81692.1 NUDIX domain-containing protein [Candidatus Limiplasma sp.]
MGEYIMDMRKRVGRIPLMQCGASVIVENAAGEILLELRADTKDWAYIGGAVELYERVEDAAARELWEETGLIADELTLLGVFSGEKLRYTYPNGDQVSNVDVVFVCRAFHGELAPQAGEVDCLRYFPIDALPELLFPVNRPGLEAYLAQRNRP